MWIKIHHYLNNKYADILYYIVAKLIWVSNRERPDIKAEILLLYTRVTKSTMEEKSKLKVVLQFLKRTINNRRLMVTYNLSKICIWVDYTYGVHPDMKSYTSVVYILVMVLHIESPAKRN